MKSLLLKTIAIITIFITSLGVLTVSPAFAEDICNNTNVSDDIKAAAGCTNVGKVRDLSGAITDILKVVIGISGIIAVIFVIIGGINFMTSSGDSGKVKKAKDTILYAVIGIIVCALAFAIVNFVIAGI